MWGNIFVHHDGLPAQAKRSEGAGGWSGMRPAEGEALGDFPGPAEEALPLALPGHGHPPRERWRIPGGRLRK